MTTFRYPPAYARIDQKQLSDQTLHETMFVDHVDWLESNDIEYTVVGFRWPEIVTMLFSHDPKCIGVEFDLTIEDDEQAVMFRLYSGLQASV